MFESGREKEQEDFSTERTGLHSKIGEPERSGDRQMGSICPQGGAAVNSP